ncbi:MAG: glycosyltransferase [Cytophagales bacterium]|nr:glycosyltransferase [Armatimonadota bacterium]
MACTEGVETRIVSADAPGPVPVYQGEILVLHRLGFAGAGGRFLKAARQVGALVVWSTDDLIFTPDFAHHIGLQFPDDPVRYRQHRAAGKDFAHLMRSCDAVLVSTEYLAQCARGALACPEGSESIPTEKPVPPPVYVVRNFLCTAQLKQAEAALLSASISPRRDKELDTPSVTLAYLSGSATHDRDLAAIAAPLAATLARFSQVNLLLVGPVAVPSALQTLAGGGRVLRHPFVPWEDLPGLFTHCRVDINLAPLDLSRPFGHAKSEVKFLEAAAVGVPTIASHAAGFAEGIRPGENCLLAASGAEWEQVLSDLIGPTKAGRIGDRAKASLQERGTAATNAALVRAAFQELAQRQDFGSGPKKAVVVRPAARDRAAAAWRRLEQKLMWVSVRGQRHLRLLRAEVE